MFLSSPSVGTQIVIKQTSRCTTNKGGYQAEGNCRVELVWDNSFSWMNSKDIIFDIFATAVDEDELKTFHKE